MKFSIKLDITVHECDKTGRHYLRFKPVIKPNHCASGELRTAHYEAWLDEPDTIATQKQAAINGAHETLAYLFS